MNQVPVSVANFLRKISPKTVMEKLGVNLLALPRPVQARVLYDLFGVTNRVKQGTTDKGEWVAFLGEFEAVTPEGEIFQSGRAHIPVLEDMLFAALAKAQEADPKASIQVALRVSIVPAPVTKPSATGYEYEVQSIVPPQQSNAIAALKQMAAQHRLAAPAKVPEGTVAVEPLPVSSRKGARS